MTIGLARRSRHHAAVATALETTPGRASVTAGIGDAERASGESVFVGAIPRTSTDQGDFRFGLAMVRPLALVGRQALPYPPVASESVATLIRTVSGDDHLGVGSSRIARRNVIPCAARRGRYRAGVGRELHRAHPQSGRARTPKQALIGTTFIWSTAVAAAGSRCAGDRISCGDQRRTRWIE